MTSLSPALRALFLTSRSPIPPVSGGQVLSSELVRKLSQDHVVTIAVLSDCYADDGPHADELAFRYAGSRVFPSDPVEPGPAPFRIRAHRSEAFQHFIAAEIASGSYDVVHCESYFMLQHVPADCDVPVVLLEENVEWQLDRTLSGRAPEYAQENWIRNRNVILANWSRAQRLVFLTEGDRDEAFRESDIPPSTLLRFGWDHLPTAEMSQAEAPIRRCVFVGNFGWQPTKDATNWLVDDIWPKVRVQMSLPLLLVGAGMSPADKGRWSTASGVTVVGQVESVADWLDSGTILIAPMRSSSGSSVKVIEALRRGAQVVSTRRIAEALPDPWSSQVWTAEDPSSFASAVSQAVASPKRASSSWPIPTWHQAAAVLEAAWLSAAGRPIPLKEMVHA